MTTPPPLPSTPLPGTVREGASSTCDASDDAPEDASWAAACTLSLAAAADLQDDLLAAECDLERLQALLDDSHATLEAGFFAVLEHVGTLPPAHVAATQSALLRAVKGLQFQDMSSQLLSHTRRRLRHAADRVARDALPDDGDAAIAEDEAPHRPNPVAQSAMNSGFVELF